MSPLDAAASTADALSAPDAFTSAAFLLLAFALAGVAQTVWFAAPQSRLLAMPLDGGLTIRGRRIFGDHKTIRGFIVMVPAAAGSFAILARVVDPAAHDLWRLTPGGYAALGAWAALGFMAGELPNSFVKRQLDIPPGGRTTGHAGQVLQFLIDRIDSGLGMLVAVSAAVPTPWTTWAIVLAVGALIHWSFSIVMFHLGIKQRPA